MSLVYTLIHLQNHENCEQVLAGAERGDGGGWWVADVFSRSGDNGRKCEEEGDR